MRTTELLEWLRETDRYGQTYNDKIAAADLIDQLLSVEARYKWLRARLRVLEMESMTGKKQVAFDVRIGQPFFETPTRGAKGYLDPDQFERECSRLDAEIDAAVLREGAGT